MSEPMIDAWLDGDEFNAQDFERFETWLRADAAHLREFLHAISDQEALRAAVAKSRTIHILPRIRRRTWLISAAGLVATLLVFVFIAEWFGNDLKVTSLDEEPAPPTYKQALNDLADLKGTLNFERNPDTPDGRDYRAPIGIRSGADGGSLRWLQNIDVELDAGAAIELNPQHPFATPPNVCSVSLISGKARIRQRPHPGPSANGIDTVAVDLNGGRILVKNADVTITVVAQRQPRPEPIAARNKVVIAVASGSVVVETWSGEQTVKAGETVTLEQKN